MQAMRNKISTRWSKSSVSNQLTSCITSDQIFQLMQKVMTNRMSSWAVGSSEARSPLMAMMPTVPLVSSRAAG